MLGLSGDRPRKRRRQWQRQEVSWFGSGERLRRVRIRERLGGKEDMFNFFRKTQDSKKVSLPEREADGFVLLDASVLTAQEPENASRGMIPDTQVVIQLMNREEHLKIKIHFLRQDLHTVNLFRA
ncbi:UBAP1-MVB12-associated (UMA)-domain containing protein 1 isoform X7 [Chrysemys picta bellii]|uniref:UBAP1-MVB12-associated (UMA)-domain containing protein 1 isoform X7 n=1 Tax=Chrysemys picta bellii TaxID=8478 RepID=UPI0032B19A2C